MSNIFTGTGNLGAAPELKYQDVNGESRPVCEMRVCFSNVRPDGKGGFENFDEDVWLNVSLWDDQAEACAKLLKKGKRIDVVGRIASYTREEDDGKKRTFFSVKAKKISIPVNGLEEVVFKESKKQDQSDSTDDIPF